MVIVARSVVSRSAVMTDSAFEPGTALAHAKTAGGRSRGHCLILVARAPIVMPAGAAVTGAVIAASKITGAAITGAVIAGAKTARAAEAMFVPATETKAAGSARPMPLRSAKPAAPNFVIAWSARPMPLRSAKPAAPNFVIAWSARFAIVRPAITRSARFVVGRRSGAILLDRRGDLRAAAASAPSAAMASELSKRERARAVARRSASVV